MPAATLSHQMARPCSFGEVGEVRRVSTSADHRPGPAISTNSARPRRSNRESTGTTPNGIIPSGPAITSSKAPSRACQPAAIVIATITITAP